MPIIEYKCDDCGHTFEDLVSSSDELVPCPSCTSENVHKLISLVSSKGISSGCTSCEPTKCSSKFT
jgi:putative FmdB family regulatory protein